MDKIKQWTYYIIIGVVSFISLVFLPMIGTTLNIGWNLPNTPAGWVVWVGSKLIVAVINVLIFYSFLQQGKLNVKNDENYKKAREILVQQKVKNVLPKSPAKWNAKQYSTKGVTIFITTGLTTIALGQALLAFDWISMLSYLFTIIMGVIFGILSMKSAEEYWSDEYYRYALMIQRDEQENSRNNDNSTVRTASKGESKDADFYVDKHASDNREGLADGGHVPMLSCSVDCTTVQENEVKIDDNNK